MQSHDKGRILYRFTKNMPLWNPLIQQEQIFGYFQLYTFSSPKSMKAESSASPKLSYYYFRYYFALLLWKKITGQVATLQILSEDSILD